MRVWSLTERDCEHVFRILPKSNDVSLSPSLSQLAWNAAGSVSAGIESGRAPSLMCRGVEIWGGGGGGGGEGRIWVDGRNRNFDCN